MKYLTKITFITFSAYLSACGGAQHTGQNRKATPTDPNTAAQSGDAGAEDVTVGDQVRDSATHDLSTGGRVTDLEVAGNAGDNIVFKQRDKNNEATVQIKMPDMNFDSAEGEVIKDGKVHGGRFKISARKKQNHTVKLPRAAKNIVKVYLSNKGALISTAETKQIVVGDIFLIVGQSNSTNSGDGKTRSTSGGGFMYNGKDWAKAVDPMPIAGDGSDGSSSWPTFADHYYRNTGTPAGIVSLGYAQTYVSDWQPGKWLFNRLSDHAKAFGSKGFRAVLWHQGESDVWRGTYSWDYRAGLQKIISQLRTNVGWSDLPFVIASTSYIGVSGWYSICKDHLRGVNCAAQIRNRQDHVLYGQGSTVQYTNAVYWGPNSDELWENKYRSYQGNSYIHLNVLGHEHMGWRWYDKVRLLPPIK